jgi:RNA-directed DNA polymerase
MSKSPRQSLLSQIASDDVLDVAYEWLCQRRKDYPANADVWLLRFKWQQEKTQLQRELTQARSYF